MDSFITTGHGSGLGFTAHQPPLIRRDLRHVHQRELLFDGAAHVTRQPFGAEDWAAQRLKLLDNRRHAPGIGIGVVAHHI